MWHPLVALLQKRCPSRSQTLVFQIWGKMRHLCVLSFQIAQERVFLESGRSAQLIRDSLPKSISDANLGLLSKDRVPYSVVLGIDVQPPAAQTRLLHRAPPPTNKILQSNDLRFALLKKDANPSAVSRASLQNRINPPPVSGNETRGNGINSALGLRLRFPKQGKRV